MITPEFKDKMKFVMELKTDDLFEQIDLDSLTRTEVALHAEEMLGVNLTDKEIKEQHTVAQFFKLIESKMP